MSLSGLHVESTFKFVGDQDRGELAYEAPSVSGDMAIKPVTFPAISERSVPAGCRNSANELATFTGDSGPFEEIVKI